MRFPALRHRDFRLLWSGVFVSNVGTWMQNVASAWLVYKMTGNDPLFLGWQSLCFAVPMIVITPVGGVVADRVDRVRLLVVTQSGAMLLAMVLFLLSSTEVLRPWHLLGATALGAVLLAFDNPTRQSLVTDLVSREALQNAVALNAATFTGAALLGPAVAGVLLERMHPKWIFAANAVSFVAVFVALATMRPPKRVPASEEWRSVILGGIRYALHEPWARALLLLAAVAAIFARSYQQLLPIFADDVFHAGPSGYGALLASGGIGALLGSLIMASSRDLARKGRVLLTSGLVLSGGLLLFACARGMSTAVAAIVVVSAAGTTFTVMLATILQTRVPAHLRARITSLYVVTLIGLPSAGGLVLAAVARLLHPARGARFAVAGGALVLLIALAISTSSISTWNRLTEGPGVE